MLITSRDNSLLRHARAVRDGKERASIYIEGMRLAEEALRSDLKIEAVIVSEELAAKPKAAQLFEELKTAAPRVATVSEKLLETISYTKTPQGIVVLAARPSSSETDFTSRQPETPLVVVLHRINNPVNVGAIVRTAEAAGATGVISTQTTSDPLSPKSLRGAMGSAFRLPLWFGCTYADALAWSSAHQIQTFCADAHASHDYAAVNWGNSSALIMGPESDGLSEEEILAADVSVRIPMHGPAESLNVAVAAGILLYEAARQRSRQLTK